MKRKLLLRFLLFCSIPFVIMEIVFRIIPAANDLYLSRVNIFNNLSCNKDQKLYLFIGSSRVAAAIIPEQINCNDTARNSIIFNAGRGMSTSTEFYYALKKLATDSLLENASVFIETPGGLSGYYDNSNGYWVDTRNIHLILPFLDKSLFMEFWKNSSNSFTTKCKLSFFYFSYSARFCALIKEIISRNSLLDMYYKLTNQTFLYSNIGNDEAIVNKGGIKTDQINMDKARKFAISFFEAEIHKQKVIGIEQWKSSRLNDINELIRDNNGQLILFKIPTSSIEAQLYKTEISKKNLTTFKEYISEAQISYIECNDSNYIDADFPDLWHLSEEKAIQFSNEISTYIYQIKNKE